MWGGAAVLVTQRGSLSSTRPSVSSLVLVAAISASTASGLLPCFAITSASVMVPERIDSRLAKVLRKDRPDLGEADVSAALAQFDKMWKALISAEQARVVQLAVARVTAPNGQTAPAKSRRSGSVHLRPYPRQTGPCRAARRLSGWPQSCESSVL